MAYADASAVTQRDAPSAEQCQQQVHRIIHSTTFRNALTLQQLFQFVADRAIARTTEGLKEYTIGVEAFGRKQDFDPKTDPIVRVQIHRLRQKLKEYYDAEGSHDPISIEIPKGHYLPSFEGVTVPDAGPDQATKPKLDANVSVATRLFEHQVESGGSKAATKKHRFIRLSSSHAAIAAASVLVFATGFWVGNRMMRTGAETVASNQELALGKSADPVKVFWASFLGNDRAPIVAYPTPFSFWTIPTIYSGFGRERAMDEVLWSIHTWHNGSPQTLHLLPKRGNSTMRMGTPVLVNSRLSQCWRAFLDRWG